MLGNFFIPLIIYWSLNFISFGVLFGKWGEKEEEIYGWAKFIAYILNSLLLLWLTLTII